MPTEILCRCRQLVRLGSPTKLLRICLGVVGLSNLAGTVSAAGPARVEPAAAAAPGADIDFDRDIRPLLSDHCFKCHGPDQAELQGGLRLDQYASATAASDSGAVAIVPGEPQSSELLRRIASDDDGQRMPPPEEGKQLTASQVELLTRWIAQGAAWSNHWAFEAVRRPAVPQLDHVDHGLEFVENAIDAFVLAKLDERGLRPAPRATPAALIRRLNLDLTGLPPTPAEVDAFVADPSPGAYERVVDRLLASQHFGERLAVPWLDLARYGDTSGYHNDSLRDMWLWREWVVGAFNRNLPYDQFTIEQLAGDLLPEATLDQQIASGFHRNVMTSDEGGLIDAEYRNLYVVDRVATTGVTWLGLTVACAQCHDHKYDPLTQAEFYGLYAFFNNVPENGKDGVRDRNPKPFLRLPTAEQAERLQHMESDLAERQQQLAQLTQSAGEQQAGGEPQAGGEQPAAASQLDALKKTIEDLKKEKLEFEKQIPNTMVMAEMETPRETFIKVRGNYDQDGAAVSPGVPAFLPAIEHATGQRLNRLDLAQWLTSPAHPLTARVAVNRWWAMLFGTGIVKTVNDFGAQGERPSHPELLDWLAADFMRDWDIKRAIKQMVMSGSYRQTARVAPEVLAVDSENRWLARGPRQRLDAEFLRDNALAIAGVLNPRVGGKSIKPAQPAGTWEINEMSGYSYEKSTGADLYRRGLYVYWRRSTVYPSFVTLDAPTREFCVAQRAKTSTPLQSLVLMNDPVFVEAARGLAQRVLTEKHSDTRSRLTRLWRLALARLPSEAELSILHNTLQQQRHTFADNPVSASQLNQVGDLPLPAAIDPSELAAWTALSNVLLNLNETVSN